MCVQDSDLIVGLGGHIDHGKTSLIKAINGFDGDASSQEKERGITLDISFSHYKTKSKNIAFIDVPGHQKLVKNMIAGAFCIDVFMLVVACDDGIMPQTLEHLQIAYALGIPQAICVLSKADLVEKYQIEHLKKEIKALFAQYDTIVLQDVIDFTIKDPKAPLNILYKLDTLTKILKKDSGFFRCYVDRSFSLKGIGTVVSGSILSGKISLEEKIYVCELQKEISIKGMHSHNQAISSATPSHRVAFNLSGVNSSDLKRGFLLSKKGYLRGFDSIDVVLFSFVDFSLHLKLSQIFIGSKRCNVQILVLGIQSGVIFATLKSDEKIFSVFKERFILRNEDGNLASGMVINPIIDPIKKTEKVKLLHLLYQEDFLQAFMLLSCVHKRGFGLISSLQRFGLKHSEALEIAKRIPQGFLDEKNLVFYHQESLKLLKKEILLIFDKNFNALLSAKSLSIRIFWASEEILEFILHQLESQKLISKKQGLYLNIKNQTKDLNSFVEETLFKALLSGGIMPEAPYNLYDALDIDRKIGDDALKRLCSAKKVKRLEHNVFIATEKLVKMVQILRELIRNYGYVDIALLRDKMNLSRKYSIAYLEYLDSFDDIIKNSLNQRVIRPSMA